MKEPMMLTLCLGEDSILVSRPILEALNSPKQVQMLINEEQQKTGEQLSLRSLLVLDALKQQRRLTVADLSAQLHITDAATRATVEALLEAGLVEARGSSTARSYPTGIENSSSSAPSRSSR